MAPRFLVDISRLDERREQLPKLRFQLVRGVAEEDLMRSAEGSVERVH
jgi:hypothetical protein